MINMNKLSLEKRAQIIGMLVEGNSLRATGRMADVAFNTVLSLFAQVGKAAAEYQDKALRNLKCQKLQVDEIWSFCYCKAKNRGRAIKAPPEGGTVWTWVAIDAESKLVPSWFVGTREEESAAAFTADLASRMAGKVQLTTDGYKPYINAIEDAFGIDVDYAMMEKQYSGVGNRYIGSERKQIIGHSEERDISTSYVERQNLTMRMGMRRFIRKTNGFSKKIENHSYAVALHFLHYNFARIHKSLRVTPAMQAGIADHVWSLEEIIKLAD